MGARPVDTPKHAGSRLKPLEFFLAPVIPNSEFRIPNYLRSCLRVRYNVRSG